MRFFSKSQRENQQSLIFLKEKRRHTICLSYFKLKLILVLHGNDQSGWYFRMSVKKSLITSEVKYFFKITIYKTDWCITDLPIL